MFHKYPYNLQTFIHGIVTSASVPIIFIWYKTTKGTERSLFKNYLFLIQVEGLARPLHKQLSRLFRRQQSLFLDQAPSKKHLQFQDLQQNLLLSFCSQLIHALYFQLKQFSSYTSNTGISFLNSTYFKDATSSIAFCNDLKFNKRLPVVLSSVVFLIK